MKLIDLKKELDLELLSPGADLDVEVERAFSGDMLSEVMGNAREEAVWVTIQVHENAMAVAMLKNFRAIIFSSGRRPANEVIKKAADEGIPLFAAEETSFELSGKLFQLGLEA